MALHNCRLLSPNRTSSATLAVSLTWLFIVFSVLLKRVSIAIYISGILWSETGRHFWNQFKPGCFWQFCFRSIRRTTTFTKASFTGLHLLCYLYMTKYTQCTLTFLQFVLFCTVFLNSWKVHALRPCCIRGQASQPHDYNTNKM